MQIQINLPTLSPKGEDEDFFSYEEAKSLLKQMELSVHHLQKSLSEMNKMAIEQGSDADSYQFKFNISNAYTLDSEELCNLESWGTISLTIDSVE